MTTSQPTIVLVHGAGAESASWNGVIRILQDRGYTTIGAANPLRSLSGDADYVASILATIEGPIVLVGHSYGGSVISNASRGNDAGKALVFVAAFAPEEGESLAELASRFPGSTIGDILHTVPLADGTTDLYIRQDKYHQHFAADVAPAQAALDASTQRPFRQGPERGLRPGAGLEDRALVVRVPRARLHRPPRRAPVHGRARPGPRGGRGGASVPRRRCLTPRRRG